LKLENIIRLCDGELQNSPQVFSFLDFTSDIKKVKRGSLYFCKDSKNVSVAIASGAYGVVCETPFKEKEDECALIKVQNLERSALKLVRYLHLKKGIKALVCNKIEFEIIKKISTQEDLLFVENPLISLKELSELEESSMVVTQNSELPEILNAIVFERSSSVDSFSIITQNILSVTIFHKGVIYKSLPFQTVFIKDLLGALGLLSGAQIPFDISKLNFIKYLEPLFFDKNGYQLKEQNGVSVFFEEDIELFERGYLFLKKYAKWAKVLIVGNEKYGEQLSFDSDVWLLKKFDESILQNGHYDFVLANFPKPQKRERREQSKGLFDEI